MPPINPKWLLRPRRKLKASRQATGARHPKPLRRQGREVQRRRWQTPLLLLLPTRSTSVPLWAFHWMLHAELPRATAELALTQRLSLMVTRLPPSQCLQPRIMADPRRVRRGTQSEPTRVLLCPNSHEDRNNGDRNLDTHNTQLQSVGSRPLKPKLQRAFCFVCFWLRALIGS